MGTTTNSLPVEGSVVKVNDYAKATRNVNKRAYVLAIIENAKVGGWAKSYR